MTALAWLHRVRADRDHRRAAILVGAAAGLAAAQVHWLGLLLGGALVGLPSRDLPRAVATGLAFGVGALLLFSVTLAATGSLGPSLSMGQLTYLSAAMPLVAGLVGSLVRGVV
jgi:hypothetical protein